jgi:hypothetical protein
LTYKFANLFIQGESKVSEKNNDDFIYNWRNELKQHADGAYLVAKRMASNLKEKGLGKSDVIELLAVENFDLDLAKRVASKVFDEKDAVADKNTIEVSVVPTKYADCAPIIERSLIKLSAKEFAKRLCSGPYAIVKADEKSFDSWVRLAELAKTSANGKNNLHTELKPWVEEALLNSVLVAQNEKPVITAADKSNKIFKVATRKGEATVNLAAGISSSDKFTKGNYETFGIADEFMISAADKVSPYQRLKRALDF